MIKIKNALTLFLYKFFMLIYYQLAPSLFFTFNYSFIIKEDKKSFLIKLYKNYIKKSQSTNLFLKFGMPKK